MTLSNSPRKFFILAALLESVKAALDDLRSNASVNLSSPKPFCPISAMMSARVRMLPPASFVSTPKILAELASLLKMERRAMPMFSPLYPASASAPMAATVSSILAPTAAADGPA